MTMTEVRRDERVRALLRARILFNNNSSTIDCTVRNISSGGAKLEISSALTVPSEFDLDVPQKGRTYRARLMWRDANFLGVQFVEKGARDAAQTETQATQLEQEKPELVKYLNDRVKKTVQSGIIPMLMIPTKSPLSNFASASSVRKCLNKEINERELPVILPKSWSDYSKLTTLCNSISVFALVIHLFTVLLMRR